MGSGTNGGRVTIDDVDLDDADRARIRYLSRGDLTEDEAERIVRFAKVPRDHRTPNMLRSTDPDADTADSKPRDAAHDDAAADATNHTPTAKERMCADVRRRMRDADRPSTVIDAYPDAHPSAIYRHAEGRCDCDTDDPPTTSPRVKAPECADMRRAFRAGATKRDIMADFARSSNAVNKHLFGRCDHTTRKESPVDDRISPTECAHLREAYRRNDSVSVHDLASAYGVSSSIAYKHLRGGCTHDVDVDRIPPQSVDAGTCAGMRADYKRDPRAVVARIARHHEVTRPTADYHIFGRCDCDADEPPARRR